MKGLGVQTVILCCLIATHTMSYVKFYKIKFKSKNRITGHISGCP